MVLLLATTAAMSDITFYSQSWDAGNTEQCDANTATCEGTGWTVYDNFTVPSGGTKISDFTYVEVVFSGS